MEKSEDPLLQPIVKRYPDHQWLIKGAFVTALLTSLGSAVTKIWDLFYDSWKNEDLFSDLKAKRLADKAALAAEAKRHSLSHNEFISKVEKIESAWSEGFNKRLKENLGIESEGFGFFKGTWQRFNSLGNHTRPKLVFGTVFSTAAAIGGYVLINQNAHLKRDMGSMQDRLADERKSTPHESAER